MAVTIDAIVQSGLERADVEKSNNYSTAEKFGLANDALSDLYDFIIATWQDYFATSVGFTLGSTSVIDLTTVVAAAGGAAAGIYKELGLTRTQDGYPETIEPLPGYASRNDVRADGHRRYWLMAQNLSVWPQFNGISHVGTYTLDYIPNCPVFTTGQSIQPELERWSDVAAIRMAITLMAKRRQDTSDLKQQLADKEASIIQAAGSRKAEVRRLRPIYRHDQVLGFGGIGPFPRR